MKYNVVEELSSTNIPLRTKITQATTWFDKKCFVIYKNSAALKLILTLQDHPRIATTARAVNTTLVELIYDLANGLDLDPLFKSLMTKISKGSKNEQHSYHPEFNFLKHSESGIWLLCNYYQWSVNNDKQTTMLFVDILPTTINMLKMYLQFILIVIKSWRTAEITEDTS